MFRLLKAAAVAVAAFSQPVTAAVVTLNFQGSFPTMMGLRGSGFGPFSPLQESYIANAQGGSYDFTLQYDSEATAVGGKYPLTFVSGRFGSYTDFASFTPSIQFVQLSAYTYMNLVLLKNDFVGQFAFPMYAFFALGDNDGSLTMNVLPETIDASTLDFVNVSFEIYGRNASSRQAVDETSRGLVQILPSGNPPSVPEPATWSLLLLGFGGIGFAMRRRPAHPVRSA